MEQLINALSQVKKVQQIAQTQSCTPEEIKTHLVNLETTIKSIRFPRVPNKEDAVNRSQLITDITSNFVRLEYMYLMVTGKAPTDFSKHMVKRSKEVQRWIN